MVGTLLLLGAAMVGQVDSTAPGAPASLEVRRLVRQLNAPRLAERDAAEERLVGLGPAVLDQLPLASDSVPAEVRQRLARIRQVLQQQMAKAAAQAATVTLRGDRMPLSKILASIQEQTGNKIVGADQAGQLAEDPSLNVDFDKKPFWEALDQVLAQAGLTLYSYGAEKAVTLRPRPESQAAQPSRAVCSGPFRFEPISIEARRDLRDPSQQSLTLVLEVAWEPRLSPISLQLPLDRVEAVDANDIALPVDGKQAEWEVPVTSDSMASQLRIPLVLPPRTITKVARLKGTMTALLPGKIETFRFQDLEKAKEVERRIAGVTVTLEGVRKNNNAWEVRIRIRFDEAGESLQSHRNWIFDNEAFLAGPDGKPVSWSTYETTRQKKDEVGIAYLFDLDGPLTKYTFVYKTPGAILTAEIPYEVKDIPLP